MEKMQNKKLMNINGPKLATFVIWGTIDVVVIIFKNWFGFEIIAF